MKEEMIYTCLYCGNEFNLEDGWASPDGEYCSLNCLHLAEGEGLPDPLTDEM